MGPHGRGRFSEKPKNSKATFLRMLKDLKSEYLSLIIIIVFAICSSVLSIVTPIYLGNFINEIMPKGTDVNAFINNPLFDFDLTSNAIYVKWDYFFKSFGTLLGLYALSAIFSWVSEFISVGVGARFAYNFRDKLLIKLDKLPLSYYDRVPYGDTLSVSTNDVDNVSRNLQSIITQLTSGVALFFGTLIGMLIYDYRLALIALCALPVTVICVFFITKNSKKQFASYRSLLGVLNGKIEENYAGLTVIKLFNQEENVENSFLETNKEMAKADGLSQFLSGFVFPCTIFINNVTYVFIAVVGGLIGQIGTMFSFFNLLNLFTRPFQQIGQIANVIQSVLASAERIYNLLDEKEEIKDKENAIVDENLIQGEFDFNHVYFQYVKDKPLIEDFTLHVNKGDTVAIVGPTGAGKTTMVNLIMRFYEITNIANHQDLKEKSILYRNAINELFKVEKINDLSIDETSDIREATELERNKIAKYLDELYQTNKESLSEEDLKHYNFLKNSLINVFNNGNIKLDGRTIFNYSRNCLRDSVGMVLQDTWLFKGTIKENLLFGDPNATDEEIINACKEAHADHFIQTLPNGYNFMLSEDGENLSQGQKQLLTIARAIISKPKILILDEATSSVDTRTEKQIQDALDRIMKNTTSFVIAHRLSTIKNAKLIIVMKKGHIVETGTHYELLKKGGFYADLYNSQFSGVNPTSQEILES